MIVLGEDVGKFGGVFCVIMGLYDEFGLERVIDILLFEGGIIGIVIGMVLYGMCLVLEIQFVDFIWLGYD